MNPVETSVVIRTLNEGKHLGSLMQGIHNQSYQDWEIVLVDSGSTDDTLSIAQEYGARIFHIPSNEFTFGRSLNIGCSKAKGKYLVFASGHVWPITNSWLKNITRPFEEQSVAMVYGRQRGTIANRLSELRDLEILFGSTSHILVDEPKGNNGNSAIRRELWEQTPFDETLTGLEDVDWARKLEQKGYRVYYAADASVRHVHEETLRQVYNRYRREAIATKRMFPHYQFSLQELLRGIPYSIVRDALFGIRHNYKEKLIRVPATRIAQFIGMYHGVRHQGNLSKKIARQLKTPTSNQVLKYVHPGEHQHERREVPRLERNQSLVQIAFSNVRDWNLKDDSSIALGKDYAGLIIESEGGFRKGQKVAGTVTDSQYSDTSTEIDICAEYLAVDSRQLQLLPTRTPLKHGALIGTIAACLQGLDQVEISQRKSACIHGAGSIGNFLAQMLSQKMLNVTVVDKNDNWLSLVDKYEVDTLSKFGSLSDYDYIFETSGEQETLQHILAESNPNATVVSINPRVHSKSKLPGGSKLTRIITPPALAHRQLALRLINSRSINLENHTSTIEPLLAYQKALELLRNGDRFNVILNVSQYLEEL